MITSFAYFTILPVLLTTQWHQPADPARPGPYRVGVRTIEIIDADRLGRRLTTEVWYPALDEPGTRANQAFDGIPSQALRDAKPAAGRFPVVLFSHGLSAMRESSAFWTEHLATHGYIVAAPDHQYNTSRDFRPFEVYQSGMDRPLDLRVVIDALLARAADPADPLFGKMRPDLIAASGQSLGAYTALAVGGAWVDGKQAPRNGTNAKPDYFVFADPRIKAVIAFVPFIKPVFSPFGLQQMTAPVLLIGGSADQVTPYAQNQRPIFEALAGPKYLARLDGASHFTFNNEEMTARAAFMVQSLHNPTRPRAELDPEIYRLTIAFLDRHLLGLDRYANYLSPDQPGIELEARNIPVPARPYCSPVLRIERSRR